MKDTITILNEIIFESAENLAKLNRIEVYKLGIIEAYKHNKSIRINQEIIEYSRVVIKYLEKLNLIYPINPLK